jgi:hypothetical protein
MVKVRKATASFFMVLLVLSSIMVFTPVDSVSAAPVKVYVDPPQVVNQTLVSGATFYVSVRIDDILASPGIAGVEFILTWNSTVLKATNMTEVMFDEVTPKSEQDNIWRLRHEVDNTAGFVFYGYTFLDLTRAINGGYAPIFGNHTIAIIGFEVKSIGSCALRFALSKLGDLQANPVNHETVDGLFSNLEPFPPEITSNVEPPQKNETEDSGSIFYFAVTLGSMNAIYGVMGASFKLTWDPTLLQALNLTEVMFHDVTPEDEWDNIWRIEHEITNADGYLIYAYTFGDTKRAISSGYAPIRGNHTLAVVAFRVKGIGKCALRLMEFKVGGTTAEPIHCNTVDAFFKNLLRGDVNEDNAVNIYDAIMASHAFGSSPEDKDWNSSADLDGNNMIDIYDIVMLASNFGRKA